MKKEVILIIGKILTVSTALIFLIAIIFEIPYSLSKKSPEDVFDDVLLGILFSAGFIMGIISIVYNLYKEDLLDIFSKEDSANKPK